MEQKPEVWCDGYTSAEIMSKLETFSTDDLAQIIISAADAEPAFLHREKKRLTDALGSTSVSLSDQIVFENAFLADVDESELKRKWSYNYKKGGARSLVRRKALLATLLRIEEGKSKERELTEASSKKKGKKGVVGQFMKKLSQKKVEDPSIPTSPTSDTSIPEVSDTTPSSSTSSVVVNGDWQSY